LTHPALKGHDTSNLSIRQSGIDVLRGRDGREADYDAFEHLCADAFDDPRRGAVAVLTVYSDASYNQPSSIRPNPFLLHTVGCYIARVEDWRKFRTEWRLELAKKGLDHFHMNKFEYAVNAVRTGRQISRKDAYYGWSEDEFVPFLKRLQRVINRKRRDGSFRMEAFISSVVKPDFEKTLPDELRDEPGCSSPYIFNVMINMESLVQWTTQHGYDGPIHYVFAGGDKEGGNLERWFDYCFSNEVARERYKLSKGYSRVGYSIEWMKAEPALQAADIAAFEYNKLALRVLDTGKRVSEMNSAEVRRSLVNLCDTRHNGKLLAEKNLIPSFAEMVKFKKKHGSAFTLRELRPM